MTAGIAVVRFMHYDDPVFSSSEQLFPTAGPIDEEQQIGRGVAAQALGERLVAGRDALIIEGRQVGKTSLMRAAIQRSRRDAGAVVAQTDLNVDGVQNSTRLGAVLLASARECGAGGLSATGAQIRVAIGRTGQTVLAPLEAVASAAEALGVPAEIAQVVTAINDALARAVDLPFDRVLAILEADAQLRARPTAIVIDEVQEIGRWGPDGEAVENALAAAARRPNRRLTFVSAGSERHALETLFSDGRPLHVVSDRFLLPPISRDDWIAGLHDRFVTAGLTVEEGPLDALLIESKGHPLCTMHAAKETLLAVLAEGAGRVDAVHVEAGLSQARQQLWWEGFTSQ